ncbi:hypothetical protein KC19_VG308900 [Ceratodon purpureus]|uniref:Uncharacterized protein n=1 Tax=Ceratodon purpureus TaxID=3225 RepID=A0A8T0HW98_CERPU|nr:hypothetical protein KC19_VG041900 [Ceratodon purpureus]KAG0574989.1 hypothetical protein KC19_VG308900 [Ceratodon purpureus]
MLFIVISTSISQTLLRYVGPCVVSVPAMTIGVRVRVSGRIQVQVGHTKIIGSLYSLGLIQDYIHIICFFT